MRILAIDTCFGACSAAVVWPGGSCSRVELMERGHAERLVPMISELFDEVPLRFDDVTDIVVTVGPGTFTGLRIGIAAARALALATGAKTHGITSLELMARTARHLLPDQTAGRPIAIAVDARRDQVYFQLFDADLAAVTDPLLVAPGAAGAMITEAGTVVAGSGAQLIFDVAPNRCEAVLPRLEGNACHAAGLVQTGHIPGPLNPIYLRAPDAKPQDGKSLSRTA